MLFKLRRDPRISLIGGFLRRYWLDELPLLINVYEGMSFVGPRPALEHEVARYGSDMHRRPLVKPGITGLWQVSERSGLSSEEAVELDVQYVENWSPGLDLAVLLRTSAPSSAERGSVDACASHREPIALHRRAVPAPSRKGFSEPLRPKYVATAAAVPLKGVASCPEPS